MESILNFIANNIYQISIYVYLLFMFPVLVISLISWYFMGEIWVTIVIIFSLPNKFHESLINRISTKKNNKNISYRYSKIIEYALKFQKDFTSWCPIKLPTSTVIEPIQKFIFKKYLNGYIEYFSGFVDGLKSEIDLDNSDKMSKTINKKRKLIDIIMHMIELTVMIISGFLIQTYFLFPFGPLVYFIIKLNT